VSGAVLTSLIGVACIVLVYKIGNEFFSKQFALIASVLFATSPLVIVHSRMAYHTSPITFVVLLLIYSLLKVTKGSSKFLILTFLCMSLLYNFELATVVFWPIVLLVLLLGFLRKEEWFEKLKNKRVLFLSFAALIIPMLPVLIYDMSHGFPQTIKYAAWFGYKFLVFLHFFKAHGTSDSFSEVFKFFFEKNQLLFYGYSFYISLVIFVTSVFFAGWVSFKKTLVPVGIVFLSTIIPLFGFFISKTTSEAYLPMLFPGLILCFSFLLSEIYKRIKTMSIFLILIITFTNAYFIYSNNYLIEKNIGYGLSIKTYENTLSFISKISRRHDFAIKVANNKFATSIDPYIYLAWFFKKPLNENSKSIYVLQENASNIKIIKEKADSK
jgi:4-amino-4-deoxy-L-arabinose transferase-like glycosyltransferase